MILQAGCPVPVVGLSALLYPPPGILRVNYSHINIFVNIFPHFYHIAEL